jgi:hypothetical protein
LDVKKCNCVAFSYICNYLAFETATLITRRKQKSMRKLIYLSASLLLPFAFLTACSDTHDHDHLDITGFEIRLNNQAIVTQARNPQSGQIEVTGSIEVTSGETTPLLSVVFIDPDGQAIQITDSDFALSLNPVNTQVMTIHHNASQARWGFSVEGKQAGSESIQVSLLHGTHPDFESRPVTVQVHSN